MRPREPRDALSATPAGVAAFPGARSREVPWQDARLADAIGVLREAEGRAKAPPRVAAAVLAAWDSTHPERRSTRAGDVLRRAAAVAAAVTITVALAQLGQQLHRSAQTAAEAARDTRTLLVVGEPILQGEPVRVVRMRVPASTLTELGVRSATADTAAHVDVDMIVGEDGVARAIRIGTQETH